MQYNTIEYNANANTTTTTMSAFGGSWGRGEDKAVHLAVDSAFHLAVHLASPQNGGSDFPQNISTSHKTE